MRIKDYSPHRPIILGDLGVEPRVLPKLTEEQILAMQPASTQRLMKMDINEPFIIGENWKAKKIKIEETLDDKGRLIEIKADDRVIDAKTYLEKRSERDHRPAYRLDKTALIHPDNINGDFEAKTPEWQKSIAKKTAEPGHPRLDPEPYKNPQQEKWTEVGFVEAAVAWFKGKKVRKSDD